MSEPNETASAGGARASNAEQPPEQQQLFAIQPTAGEVISTPVTLHTYTIGQKLGEGSFGIVYECHDEWENDLAVKVLKPVGTYERVKNAAGAEFHKLMQLRHPNITFVHDLFEYRNAFYIVTERCHLSLGEMLQNQDGTFSGMLWLRAIARSLLQAVSFLHRNGYVHQDIHPGNVFAAFLQDEVVPSMASAIWKFKLGDLGVARLLEEIDAKNTRAQWMLPPEVMAPTEFGPIDHRIDIYHLGLLFLQIAHSKEMRFSQQEIVEGKPRELALTLPAPYNFALEKALRRHSQHRTATAAELWRDLQTLAVPPPPPTLPKDEGSAPASA